MTNFDCVQETTNSVGTGSLVLAGAAPGYLSIASYGGGRACWRMTWGDQFELFYGEVTYDEVSGLYSLARLFVLANAAGPVQSETGQIDLPAGVKTLSLVASAASLVTQNDYLAAGFGYSQPSAIGDDGLAIGSDANAEEASSIAIGPGAWASNELATAIATRSRGPGGVYFGGGQPAGYPNKRNWRSFSGQQVVYSASSMTDIDTLVLHPNDCVLAKLTIFLAGPGSYAVGELRYVFNAGTLTVIEALTTISTTLGAIPAVTLSVTTDSLGWKIVHLHFASTLPGAKFMFQTELFGA